ncbi:MAG: hypothetical protein U0M42_03700 [Acutalibacteraceae bacterium]|nr:hypothetical protein [Acutalibacteraceae bacterium]
MKRILCLLMAVAMIFSVAACGTPDEIIKDKKLSKTNADAYLNVEVAFDSVSTVYSDYDGDNPEYAGGRWKWGTANATIKISSKSQNKIEFTNATATVLINFGSLFGEQKFEVTLDEDGNWTKNLSLTSRKTGIPKKGFTSTDYAVPVASYEFEEVSGDMKIHIKLDENGSVIVPDEE